VKIVREFDRIAVEDLNIKEMVKTITCQKASVTQDGANSLQSSRASLRALAVM
jgi:hypothetical protein